MRFAKGDYIHRKRTKSWFLNPPSLILRANSKGYYIETGIEFRSDLTHSAARQWEVVIKRGQL